MLNHNYLPRTEASPVHPAKTCPRKLQKFSACCAWRGLDDLRSISQFLLRNLMATTCPNRLSIASTLPSGRSSPVRPSNLMGHPSQNRISTVQPVSLFDQCIQLQNRKACQRWTEAASVSMGLSTQTQDSGVRGRGFGGCDEGKGSKKGD